MYQDPDKITYFAKTNSRGKETPFGIKRADRARHMYVIGKTGMGKSTLLENMAIQDIRNGEGLAFIDPHGSTAERIMEYVPKDRVEDVLYFAPFDMENPIAFNIMEDVGYDKRHLVVSGLLSAFRKIWVDAWSARMEYILSNTLLALLEFPGATLLDVNRMLINKPFRRRVVENVQDPVVKSFWVDEFANYTDRYTQDATPAIQNKVGQFTSNPLIRNIVGQAKSSFDIRALMDERKIIIVNLSKGRVGEVNATLLGSMLVTKIYLAAMSRADVSGDALKRLPHFYFYVDEFQTFANQSFADILSEARKYKLNLLIAHQYVEQMEEDVRNAVFGNVGTTVAFRVGPFDAETLETIFLPQFSKEDLVNLGFAQIYLTLMIDGVGSPPFSAQTLPPFDLPPERYVPRVIESSRQQFGRPRGEVERTLAAWQVEHASPAEEKARPVRRGAGGFSNGNDGSSGALRQAAPHRLEYAKPAERIAAQDGAVTAARAEMEPERAQREPERLETRGFREPHEKREQFTPRPGAVPMREERPTPPGGAMSLREAIAKATGEKRAEEAEDARHLPDEAKEGPTPLSGRSLKDTLKAVVADNQAEAKKEAPQATASSTEGRIKSGHHPRRGMSDKELRDMLRVEEFDGEKD